MTTAKIDWTRFLARHGAIWQHAHPGDPHAMYEWSSAHTDFYLNTDEVVASPQVVEMVVKQGFYPECAKLARTPDWILSYSASISASLVLGASLSSVLDCGLAYLDLRTDRLSVSIAASEHVLIVSDDIYSGRSIQTLLKTLSDRGAVPLTPIVTVGNFSGRTTIEGLPIHSLITRSVNAWTPTECPLCRAGSAPLKARQAWQELQRSKPPHTV
jgi:hypothetical protein